MREWALEGNHGFAHDCWRVAGDWKRYETPWRLEPVFGAVSRLNRIDTLKCRKTPVQSVARRGGPRRSKHMRGGRKPNG